MIDISKQTVKIDCPECKRQITVSLKQIADEVLVKFACGKSIKLNDKNGTNKKTVNDINKAFKDLEDTFKKFGK